jgi:hypothetical protein
MQKMHARSLPDLVRMFEQLFPGVLPSVGQSQ